MSALLHIFVKTTASIITIMRNPLFPKTLLSFLTIFAVLTVNAKKAQFQDSETDMAKAQQAMEWYDAGEIQPALDIFDELLTKYPDEPSLLYEKGLCLFRLEKYAEAKDIYAKLVQRDGATALEFSMLGNCYDMMGDPQKAGEIYIEGSKRFPGKAIFFTETGNVFNRLGDYDTALKYYQRGMVVDPNFPNDYFRAASLYFASTEPIWGLIYAETEILLDLDNPTRRAAMSEEMLNCYVNNFVISGNTVEVKLVEERHMTIEQQTNNVGLECGGVLEGCYGKALTRMYLEKQSIDMKTFSTLTTLRRYMVEEYFNATDNLYGNGMYLLEFQKAVIDAGHWDAYNWLIFNDSLEFECEKWILAHEEEIYRFAEWFVENQFRLGDGKSVCRTEVQKFARPIDIVEAMILQAALLPGNSDED